MARLDIKKTYKLYIGGAFPRTESGRYYKLENEKGDLVANLCKSSRKDFRNAVVAARKAQSSWANKTGYNRGQILYRIAEMLEGRAAQFVSELQSMGRSKEAAASEVHDAIDTWVYYAGWCDKYQQLVSAVNPVASSHFNFTVPEPMGVVAQITSPSARLLGLTKMIAPAIASGNTVVTLAAENWGHVAISLGEVIHSSDVPGGVINLLTGSEEELGTHLASHKDVNVLVVGEEDNPKLTEYKTLATDNVKRVFCLRREDCLEAVSDLVEFKTTWHPVGS